MNRRHNQSDRPSVEYRHVQEHDDIDPDEEAVIEVMQTTNACTRERDEALLELSYDQLEVYMEVMSIPGDVEVYRRSIRNLWAYKRANPDIYAPDGKPLWRQHMANEAE
jgi:hypothetical protein